MEDVNIEAMPRLGWTFNAFWAAAQLRLTIADCVHLLMPGSPYHRRLLECLPPAPQVRVGRIAPDTFRRSDSDSGFLGATA